MKKRSKIWIGVILVVLVSGFIAYRAVIWNRDVYVVGMADAMQVNEKMKNAVKSNGPIELTEADLNRIVKDYFLDTGKLGNVKDGYIKILDGNIQIGVLMPLWGTNFFIQSYVKPYMDDGNIKVQIQKVYVGKIEVPRGIISYAAGRYLPEGMIAHDSTIELGNSIMMFDIEKISIYESSVRIELKQEPMLAENQNAATVLAGDIKDGQNTAGAQKDTGNGSEDGKDDNTDSLKGSTQSPESTVSQRNAAGAGKEQGGKEDPKVDALKKTNSQLYGILNDVKSPKGKNWVKFVISVNTKMMNNPDGDYSADIEKGKSEYEKLPPDVKNEVKMAAMDNLDMSSVKFLVTSYGM